jgi:hypothetical protein
MSGRENVPTADATTRRPVLVTGPHRSGTTWIGHILAGDPAVGTIHEPFTVTCRPGIFPFRIPFWYYRVPTPAPAAMVSAYENLLRFHYSVGAELRAIRSLHDVGRMIRDLARFAVYRAQRRRPVVKDPLALLSADWIAATFDSAVLVTTRHPLAFVSSLLRLGWRFDLRELQRQKDAMDLIGDGQEDVVLGSRLGAADPLVEAAYLWKVLHRVIARYRDLHPDWIFVRYEDLAREPVVRFEEIFAKLGFRFGKRIRDRIELLSGAENPPERPIDPRVTPVASPVHAEMSIRRLPPEERDRVRRIVSPVSSLFYSDQEW